MSKSMYKQGRKIISISDFDQCESLFFKWNGKTVHREVLFSLQYRILLNAIKHNRVYIADRQEDGE